MTRLAVGLVALLALGCSADNTASVFDTDQQTGSPDAGRSDSGSDLTSRSDAVSSDSAPEDSRVESDARDDQLSTSDATDEPEDGSAETDSAPEDTTEEQDQVDEPLPLIPTFSFFDELVDSIRGSTPAWASFIYITGDPDSEAAFHQVDYADTGDRVDFWPASVIKIYTATAALELLKEMDFSIEAEATFYHWSGSSWIEDTTVSFRQMIEDVFDHSSNADYTLLLRFCGVEWLNTAFFTEDKGFTATALMSGYVTDSRHRYRLTEAQRIVVSEGDREVQREHEWDGTSYSDAVGCTIYNGDHIANCSPTQDMVEHMRRIMFHEQLAEELRFDIRPDDMDWYRYGGPADVLRTREHMYLSRIQRVFPGAIYYHKAGRVTDYALDLQFVDDPDSGTRYIAAFGTYGTSSSVAQDLSEGLALLAQNPWGFASMRNLPDDVNPVTAEVTVHNALRATVSLIVKPRSEDFVIDDSWTVLPGTEVDIEPGVHELSFESDCLASDAEYHILAKVDMGDEVAPIYSDYHYVIVDADVSCE